MESANPSEISNSMISELADVGDPKCRVPSLPMGTHGDLSPTVVRSEINNECQKPTDEPTFNGKGNSFIPEAPPPPPVVPSKHCNAKIPKPKLNQQREPTPTNKQIRDETFETDGTFETYETFSQSTNTAFLEVGGERVEYEIERKDNTNCTVEEKQREYLDLVCKKYSDSIEGYFKGEKKQHKCIAALICDQVGEHPFIATFAAGTRHNDEQMCYSSAPCSMHAESLCYDAAPIFFQLEMSNCLKGNTSIFSFNENDKYFELKLDIEFHLLITEPPCGWIQQRKKPFIEWMESSVTVSHVPTCSSKIFINSKLGIQGSVSHLLTAPIFVDSVIILHDKSIEDVALKTNFDPEGNFRLPNVVLLEYDPKMLSGIEKTFMPMNLIYKYIQKSAASDISADSTQRETTKQKESDISADSTQQETTEQKTTKQKAGKGDYNKGFVHIEHSDGRRGRLFQLISKHTKKDKDSGPTVETITKIEDCGLTITEQMVLEGLQQAVDEKFQAERKDDMKQMYIDLTRSYGQDAIDCKLRELQRKIDSLEKTIKDSKDVFQEPISFYPSSEFDEHMTKLKKKWEIIQMNGKKICDYYCMTENINQSWKPDTIGVQNCITIDCSWQKYFNNAFSSSVQPDS